MRIVIVTSKGFDNYSYLVEKCLEIIAFYQYGSGIPSDEISIVTNAYGISKYGWRFAKDYDIRAVVRYLLGAFDGYLSRSDILISFGTDTEVEEVITLAMANGMKMFSFPS